MTIYHGTDQKSAKKIQEEQILKGEFGPGICLTIERALEHSAARCEKNGLNFKTMGCIVVIEGIPGQILNNASKHSDESFILNDEFGNPSVGLHLQRVKIMSIKDAEHLAMYEKNEFKVHATV